MAEHPPGSTARHGDEPPFARAERGSGDAANGVPYIRFGRGPREAVVFPGLSFKSGLPTGLDAYFQTGMYRFVADAGYTVWLLGRRQGLPRGYSFGNMAADNAGAIEELVGRRVDVIGTSTGGSLALQFAADHPELVRRLVIHSSACRLGDSAKQKQLRARDFAADGRWREANAEIIGLVWRPNRIGRFMTGLASLFKPLGAPADPTDTMVTIEAEDAFDLEGRLSEIESPTLVIAGDEDACYPTDVVRATARGIPGSKLVLYPGKGHPAMGAQFRRDVLVFLLGEGPHVPNA